MSGCGDCGEGELDEFTTGLRRHDGDWGFGVQPMFIRLRPRWKRKLQPGREWQVREKVRSCAWSAENAAVQSSGGRLRIDREQAVQRGHQRLHAERLLERGVHAPEFLGRAITGDAA